ncbi:hypothetical protein JW935_07610 [candidate division KSB1 bacterium]|nr:hypothetical protein [candidate division KSB1 bacterium]
MKRRLEHVMDFPDAVRDYRPLSGNVDIGVQAVEPSYLAVAVYGTGKRMTRNRNQMKSIRRLR